MDQTQILGLRDLVKAQLTLVVAGVKFTFWHFPYSILHQIKFGEIISMPDPLAIGVMKAFALGRRAKWKDYVDLDFIFKKYSLNQVISLAETYFGSGEFDSKLFRGQLAYHADMDYGEDVIYRPGFEQNRAEILARLLKKSLEEFLSKILLNFSGFLILFLFSFVVKH